MTIATADSRDRELEIAANVGGWAEHNQRSLMKAVARVREYIEHHVNDHEKSDDDEWNVARQPTDDMGGETSSAVQTVTETFGLSGFERDVLLLCAGVQLDGRIASLMSTAGVSGAPTFGLALAALPDAHWSALAPGAPLRTWRLIEPAGTDVTTAPLRIDERILHFLAGVNHLDQRLRGIVDPLMPPTTEGRRQPSDVDAANRVAGWIRAQGARTVAQITGADADSRRGVAAEVCALLGVGSLRLRAHDIPSSPAERFDLARLLAREAVLAHAVIVIELVGDANGSESPESLRVASLVDSFATPLIVCTATPVLLEGRELVCELEPRARASLEGRASWATRVRLDALAQRVTAIAEWKDLVLPDAQLGVLRDIATHVRWRDRVYGEWGFGSVSTRGLGISALFTGPSGTGKTTAAEVLARELDLDLYRVDLAGVVSKYIGETEKNLKRLFDAAEGSGVILLFDEADALFGKRSEVKDSHDRYANIEISYLLQRMESYHGLAILTSNMKQAIDQSFLRRIRFVVHFPFPGTDAREELWRRVFPDRTPTAALDFSRLSQLNVAGGSIRNIALGAAFLAADAGEIVTMAHIAQASRAEYTKLERPLSDGELRGWV